MNTKLLVVALTLMAGINVSAQDFFSWEFGVPQQVQSEPKLKFVYDANFDYNSIWCTSDSFCWTSNKANEKYQSQAYAWH